MTGRVLRERAKRLLDLYRRRGMRAAAAESCTGGLVAAALTEVPGSSDVFECSFVTYSNEAKHELLGVPTATLRRYGAVSAQTAAAMARGALQRSGADCAVSITGIAGPSGGSKEKPVGLVYFAATSRNGKALARRRLFGNIGRQRVRELSALEALALFARLIEKKDRRAT